MGNQRSVSETQLHPNRFTDRIALFSFTKVVAKWPLGKESLPWVVSVWGGLKIIMQRYQLFFCIRRITRELVIVQSLSCDQLFATTGTAAHQASLSFTISLGLLRFMSIESVMLSNHLTLCCPLLLPSVFTASESFPRSEFFTSGGKSIGTSASVLPMNIHGWFPLGLTGLISLLSKRLSRVFPRTTIWKHQFFSTQPSLWTYSHICRWLQEKP